MTDGSDLWRAGIAALGAQPFSRLMGAELELFEPGRAVLRLPVRPEHRQQFGYVHGGVLSYAADNALTFAGGSVLGTNVLTAEFKLNYLRPATGHTLIARAVCIHHGRRQAVCVCDIYLIDDDVDSELHCATALGTIVTAALKSSNGQPV